MRLLKRIFGRGALTVTLLILQLLLIFLPLAFAQQVFWPVQVASYALGFILAVYILNRKEYPEFKIPWLILTFLVPFFAAMVYAFLAHPKPKKSDIRFLNEVNARVSEYLPKSNQDGAKEYAGASLYISGTSRLHGYSDSKIDYFPTGEAFWKDLLSELEKAEKFIFMEYFVLANGVMWEEIYKILKEKASKGVEVRVLYDDIGSLKTLKSNFYKKVRKDGINCYKFNPFRFILSGIYNNRDHRKITVIDGKVCYTGGANVADEYINVKTRFGYWKDSSVKIQGAAVANFTALFLMLFDTTAKKLSYYPKYFEAENQVFSDCGYVHPFGDGPRPYYSEQISENNYLNLINAAKNYVYISTPYLICDYTIITALRNAAQRGIDVRIIIPAIPDKKTIYAMTRSLVPHLLEAGVKIYKYNPGFIHSKMLLSDDCAAYVGTANLDYRSFVHHYECGAAFFYAPAIKDVKADFEGILKVSSEITSENFKMSKAARAVSSIISLFSPML